MKKQSLLRGTLVTLVLALAFLVLSASITDSFAGARDSVNGYEMRYDVVIQKQPTSTAAPTLQSETNVTTESKQPHLVHKSASHSQSVALYTNLVLRILTRGFMR